MIFIKGHDDPVYPVNSSLYKYLNDELKILCLLQFFPEVAQNSQNSLSIPGFPGLWPPCIRFMRIFVEVPWGWASNIVGLSRTAIFSIFAGYFPDTFETRPTLLYTNTQSVVGFSVIPNAWPWMTLNGYFAFNSVFTPVWLADTVRLSKNNCVKSNKDRHIVSAVQILGRDSSFWQYKACVDIRLGSLERRR